MKTISAIIPARNEEANIVRVVESLAAQPEVREIIVVDDGSTDGTPAVLEQIEDPRLHILRQEIMRQPGIA